MLGVIYTQSSRITDLEADPPFLSEAQVPIECLESKL